LAQAAFLFAVASWIYPLLGFYGVMLSAVLFLLLALISLLISERLRVRCPTLQPASLRS